MNIYLKCYVIAIALSFAFSLPVQLSEDVLQRMRGVANIPPERSSSSTSVPKKDTGIFFFWNSFPHRDPRKNSMWTPGRIDFT